MKKLVKFAGMPVVVLALAISGVYASNAAKNAEAASTIVPGYLQVNSEEEPCVEKINCQIEMSAELCSWYDFQQDKFLDLYHLQRDPVEPTNASLFTCTIELYRVE